ncbi:hypothetical protein BKA62DRAFT_46804 [Auriculariales sp. MPI-PUGE-AT-0066]|nr:hypothetical protein BKA62DRAFT_46804 [Auriculariales sp. MPI-PUGE-AT-0066]
MRSVLPWLLALLPGALADGPGLIGLGKHMYRPACAFACRTIIGGSPLACTPDGEHEAGGHHGGSATPPECFLSDPAFLRSMALCIVTYCPEDAWPAPPSLSQIEDYWASHLATGSIGDYTLAPTQSYSAALVDARADEAKGVSVDNSTSTEHDHGSSLFAAGSLPVLTPGDPLTVTSTVAHEDWLAEYNGSVTFESNENGHGRFSLILVLVSLFLPVVLSLVRFVPGIADSRLWTKLNASLNHAPLIGNRYRVPVPGGIGFIPTRGQTLYIILISALNIGLLVPIYYVEPQSWFPDSTQQAYCVIADRAGSMALANLVAAVVFSSRNNILIHLTNWSHGTFLLLHRWLAYWGIGQTVLHSLLSLARYVYWSDYKAEFTMIYWKWGIVGTMAAVIILPASLLVVRTKFYEIFLAFHHLCVVFFLVGTFLHIWYLFTYDWGYEIWIYIIGGIWGVDRLWRLLRVFINGLHTATVSAIDGTNGEYLHISIDNVHAHGVVYLYFPTLTWRFWENHPFSVAASFAGKLPPAPTSALSEHVEKGEISADSKSTSSVDGPAKPSTTFIARVRTGITATLARRLGAASSVRVTVLLEGPYHSVPAATELARCDTLVAIAGGVGITAVLPLLQTFGAPRRGRLYWGVRQKSLVSGLDREIALLPPNIGVTTSVGARLDVAEIVEAALVGDEHAGLVGIMVCGPPGMADDVRKTVVSIGQSSKLHKPFVFVDDAFGW